MWFLRRDPLRRCPDRSRRPERHERGHDAARPRWSWALAAGAGGARAPTPLDHRSEQSCRPAHGGQRTGADGRLQWLYLQLSGIARRVGGEGLSLLLPGRYRGGAQGLSCLGRCLCRAFPWHVRLRRQRARFGSPDPDPRPARDQTAVLGRGPGRAALRLDPAGAAGGRRGGDRHRPGGAPPLYALSCCGARAAHHPERGAQAAAGDHPRDRARRAPARSRLLGSALRAAARGTRSLLRGLAGADPGEPAHRRRPAAGGGCRCRGAALGRARFQPDRRAAGRAGTTRAQYLLGRLRDRGRARSATSSSIRT